MRTAIPVLLSLVLLTAACGSKDTTGTTPEGSYSFTLDGHQYSGVAKGAYAATEKGFTLTIADGGNDGLSIAIIMPMIQPEIYTNNAFSFGTDDAGGKYTGTVTTIIPQINVTYVEGTFFGIITTPDGSEAELTDGVFKVPIGG